MTGETSDLRKTPEIKKKFCTLGAYAVGKTSLMARFVKSIFSDRYLTTIGVKIDKKEVQVDGQMVTLMLWDLAGEDEYLQARTSYLRAASGYLLVVDRTRPDTLTKAFELKERVDVEVGKIPFILVFNKSDLTDDMKITAEEIEKLRQDGWDVLETSAKTGQGVEEAFLRLTRKVL
jgi:small GTP-binding protein